MMHIADRFILDMAVEGDACEIELSTAARLPEMLKAFETDSYGCWQVLSVGVALELAQEPALGNPGKKIGAHLPIVACSPWSVT